MPNSATQRVRKRPSLATAVPATSRRASNLDSREIVLFAVTGMSPAVLTETIWALATGPSPVVPHTVVVVTTEAGRTRLESELFATPLGRHPSVWLALHAELAARGVDVQGRLHLDRGNGIRVFSRPGSVAGETDRLTDIRTAADNETAGDFLLRELRGFTDDDDTQVIASIAGGRKTMGALLYAVMTLVGRDTDRLTHVLVEEPFDDARLQPRFYFPGQPGGLHKLPDGRKIGSRRATLELADVPFVPLREVFPRELGQRPGRFMALVNRYRLSTPLISVGIQTLKLDLINKTMRINETEFSLSARQATVMGFLGRSAKAGRPPYDSYKAAHEAIFTSRGWNAGTDPKTLSDEDRGVFSDLKGNAENLVRKALDDIKTKLRKLATPESLAFVNALPARGRFSLKLPPEVIEIIG
jgi:CRISPR-associated protein (TIGR02584 family)